MGWKLKALAFIVALVAIQFGAWIITIPLLLYVFSGLILRRWRRQGRDATPQSAEIGWKRSGSRVWVKAIGAFFLVLALAAFAEKGTLSPYVFGFLGLVLMLSGPLSRSSLFGGFKAVADSILLRGTANPFTWVALAEVKLLTHDVGKALLGISERIIVVTSERPSIYLSVRVVAPSRRGAEQKILERFVEANKTVAPLGAYLLPMDGGKATDVLGVSVKRVELNRDDLTSFLSSTPYDLLSLDTEYGLLKSIGVYRKVGVRKDGGVSVPPSWDIPSRLPLVAEVFGSVGARVEWPNPDVYTAFLTSMFATRFASGEVRVESGDESNGQVVLARALASPPVELSRAQLRAIEGMYAPAGTSG